MGDKKIKDKIGDAIWRAGFEAKNLPYSIWLELDSNKRLKEMKKPEKEAEKIAAKESKKERKEQFKQADKAYGVDSVSEEMLSSINAFYNEDPLKVAGAAVKAAKTLQLVKYTLYYMTDSDAKIIELDEKIEKEIVNSIAKLYDFGKIFDDAGYQDLNRFDLSSEKCIGDPRYILSVKDIMSWGNNEHCWDKMEARKEQLIPGYERKAFVSLEEKESVAETEEKVDAKNETIEAIQKVGKKGENEVEFQLKWLPDEYKVVSRGDKGIRLLIDEMEHEIDHIVISSQGVYLIETKALAGKITIDEQGNWIREKNGNIEGIKNPMEQVNRHHIVLEKLLGIQNIYDVICIADSRTIIEGANNCVVPVVKSDMLLQFFKEHKGDKDKILSVDEQKNIEDTIEKFRIE